MENTNTNDIGVNLFLTTLEFKINNNEFTTKKELTDYIEKNGYEFQDKGNFNHKILELLNKFDEINSIIDDNRLDGLTKDKEKSLEDSIEVRALKYYNDLNHLGLMFTESGLAIDKDGNTLEAILDINGNISIYQITQPSYNDSHKNTGSRRFLYKVTSEQLDTYNSTANIILNERILDYLKNNLARVEEILNDPALALTEEEKNLYRNAISLYIKNYNNENSMDKKQSKQYVYKPMIKNAFVSTVILSLSTLLFGMLCLTYFLINI